MVSHHSGGEEHEVSDFEIKYRSSSYDQLQSVFNELYDEYLKLSRKFSKQKKTILNLESEANITKVELDLIKNSVCNNCSFFESKIVELNQVIAKYEKGLDNMLSSQIFSNNKYGLGFSNFDKTSSSQTIFVKATSKFNKTESKKEHVVSHHKIPYNRNKFYVNKKNHVFRPICFYLNAKGHTSNACYIRNYGIPYGEYVQVIIGSKPRESKEYWLPQHY